MKYELLAIDLDDTLLNHEGKISSKNLQSIKRAVDAGVKVCIATGRAFGALTHYYDEMQLDTPTICFGGAQVLDKDANVIYSTGIDSDTSRKVLERAYELDLHAHAYRDREFFYKQEGYFSDFYRNSCNIKGVEVPDILKIEDLTTPKIVCCQYVEKMPEIRKTFEEEFTDLVFYHSHPTYLEVMMPGVNKGTALNKLCEHLGIKSENVAAIGDSEIDIALLEYAGLAGAVENATKNVKAAADCTVPSNNDNGVAYFIDNYILCE